MGIFHKQPPAQVAVSKSEVEEAFAMLSDALRKVLDTLALASKHATAEKVAQNLVASDRVQGVVSVVSAPVAAEVSAKPAHKI